MAAERIGFIGLGIMGRGMVGNLQRAGHDVAIWNRTASRTTPFVEAGGTAAESPALLAAESDIVFLNVSDTPDVVQVVTDEWGVLSGLTTGSLVVDHSTISPSETLRLADLVADAGGSWIDAPVSGGSEGAERGTLAVMVGGDPADVSRARPFMDAYSASITHVGPVGAGQLVKLVNQILVVVNQLAASEALLFAKAAGLDLDITLEAVKEGAAGSWMLTNRWPQMVADDWTPGFTIDLQQKDLRLVLEEAERLGLPLMTTAFVNELYISLQDRGLGGEGNHALIKALTESPNIRLNDVAAD